MTPFGRQPVTAGLLATQALAEAPAPAISVDKWAILRDLTTARAALGVSDRDLAVLSALLSFHPSAQLSDDHALIVFPSNASLSARAHGMAESTLRRHLASLVRAGLILRRDSPNGKRYATRDLSGRQDRAFGLDLRPLLVRATEIAETAQNVAAAQLATRRLRQDTVIRIRDAAKLIEWGRFSAIPANWDALSDLLALARRQLRRKLDDQELVTLAAKITLVLDKIKALVSVETTEMSGNVAENERHHQSSTKELSESEPCKEGEQPNNPAEPAMPLGLVLKAVPDICDYTPDDIRSWRDFVALANFVRPMLGISNDLWRAAQQAMGDADAAITLACILQRSDSISRPGAYLRTLTAKAMGSGFSPGPMVMALIRAENLQPG